MIKKTGGQAFPRREVSGDVWNEEGMTLRDWFAGQALTGGLSSEDESTGCVYMTTSDYTREEIAAREAYKMADAMIKERDK